MSDPDNAVGYAGAVDAYLAAGWVGVLPMERGHKKWPPSIKCADAKTKPKRPCRPGCECISYTGHQGIDPSYADITAWSERFRDGNLCLRVPNNDQLAVVGVDVDAYGAKTGAEALAEAVKRWGPLPPGPRSTSRPGDFVSGIRLFRIPAGTILQDRINFPELGIGDIEICQHHHRYVIAWPSIHPEDRPYWWRNDADQLIGIPEPTGLPWLPQPWIDGLAITPHDLTGDAGFDVAPTLTLGDATAKVQQRLSQAIKELNLPGTSRHDTTLRHVMALMRMGKSGEPGVKHSLQLLCDVFVAATSVDGSRSPDEARGEFVRMITNDQIARELSRPGLLDWMDAIGDDSAPSSGGSEGADAGATAETGSLTLEPNSGVQPRSVLEEIEAGFWNARESLQMIYTTAMARMAPPWGVLAICAARALTQVRPHTTLPPLIGGPGSLNWFAALVAASGGGKGASSNAADLLIPGHEIQTRNVGSGEGIIAAFSTKADDDNPAGVHEAIMFSADEIDTLAALNQRTASTTLSILRSGFSGETLGFSYADRSKRQHIARHTYRMTLVMSVQPRKAGWLLADEGGGTPQRFMWFPSTDSRISKQRPWESGPLTLPHPNEWRYPREVAVPAQAADLILDERVKAMRGDQNALDGHALFCREKFAYALAVLDGRVEMTIEDWELSGIAASVSMHTREMTIEALRTASDFDATERGSTRGIELAAADAVKDHERAEIGRRIYRWMLDKIIDAGEAGIANRDLSRKAPNTIYRRGLDRMLPYGESQGLIRKEGTRWYKM